MTNDAFEDAAAPTSAAMLLPHLPACYDLRLAEDFDELWTILDQRYCFFNEKRTDWGCVRGKYRPLALVAASDEAFARVVDRVLAELYDAHTHSAKPLEGTWRYPPYDLVVESHSGSARVAAVRTNSVAEGAGIEVGARITAIDGVAIGHAVTELMPKCLSRPDPAAIAYAWNSAVAGRSGQQRCLNVNGRCVVLRSLGAETEPTLASRQLEDGLGYIRIASFADPVIVTAFDDALAALRHTRGLIIDVRNNGGGDTAVARPIMGRFIAEERPYASMRRREGTGLGPSWTEAVEPRGPFTYKGPVIVLVDHWSASMAEGFPMGMRAITEARIVGTAMMGLGAAVSELRLGNTGIALQYSAEPVYDITGLPRWTLRPDVSVPEGEDILSTGVQELRRLVSLGLAAQPKSAP